jgi:hypothetical protein
LLLRKILEKLDTGIDEFFSILMYGIPMFGIVFAMVILFGYGNIIFFGSDLFLQNTWVWLGVSVVAAEALFFLDKQKFDSRNNASRFWFTAKVKIECYLDVLAGLLVTGVVWFFVKRAGGIYEAIEPYLIYPLIFIGVVGFVAVYIWINSLKYKYKKAEPREI